MLPTHLLSLPDIAAHIEAQSGWWLFPSEPTIRGFLGDGDVFFVGDQPSTSPWPRTDRGRRAFYDGLEAAGLENAHLTDLVKSRAKAGALKHGLPADFNDHVELFRRELDLLKPRRVVAVGHLSECLLRAYVPEVAARLRYVTHFAFAVRSGVTDYPTRLAVAAGVRAPEPETLRAAAKAREPTSMSGLASMIAAIPGGVRPTTWTLRRDNRAHHHGVVFATGGWVYLDLSWRPSQDKPATRVGLFRLDVRGLLDAGCVRYDPKGVVGPRIRVRIVMRDDDTFVLQVRRGSPIHFLG